MTMGYSYYPEDTSHRKIYYIALYYIFMIVLGIETSCDETAVGIVKDKTILLSNEVLSSMNLHSQYGGVVPEIASRSHLEAIIPTIEQAIKTAKVTWEDIDAISVTYGAGLSGSLLIGVMTAKTLAQTLHKPLYGANHVMGHVFANFLRSSALKDYSFPKKEIEFPMLAVILSGGHTQLVLFRDFFDYKVLGITQDDAIGEAFDKVSKMLGLGYPGGVAVSKLAETGNKHAFQLPIAKMPGYDFSYSGLKTALLRRAQVIINQNYTFPSIKLSERLNLAQKADLAASFEYTAIKTIVDKVKMAYEEFSPNNIVIAGGVAANSELRRQLHVSVSDKIEYPDLKLCTDNGAMIATLGCYMYELGKGKVNPNNLTIQPNLKM